MLLTSLLFNKLNQNLSFPLWCLHCTFIGLYVSGSTGIILAEALHYYAYMND